MTTELTDSEYLRHLADGQDYQDFVKEILEKADRLRKIADRLERLEKSLETDWFD